MYAKSNKKRHIYKLFLKAHRNILRPRVQQFPFINSYTGMLPSNIVYSIDNRRFRNNILHKLCMNAACIALSRHEAIKMSQEIANLLT